MTPITVNVAAGNKDAFAFYSEVFSGEPAFLVRPYEPPEALLRNIRAQQNQTSYAASSCVLIYDLGSLQQDHLAYIENVKKSIPVMHTIIIFSGKAGSYDTVEHLLNLSGADFIDKMAMHPSDVSFRAFKKELCRVASGLARGKGRVPEGYARKGDNGDTGAITLRPLPKDFSPEAIAIAASTGGPRVLNTLLEKLGKNVITQPVFITQHMPKDFTTSFVRHMTESTSFRCVEAQNQQAVEAGTVYVAPGGYHMEIYRKEGQPTIRLNSEPPENFCRPSADPMLRSLAKTYGGKHVLAVVLTGLGKDALAGCKMIADQGGVVLAQDKASSVIWGMPGAVAAAGICNAVVSGDALAQKIAAIITRGSRP